MSERTFKRLVMALLMTWTFACGFVPFAIISGCSERKPAIVKPSAGKIVVPPQCFLPMYCKTPECNGARAEYQCYKVVPDEPKGDSK